MPVLVANLHARASAMDEGQSGWLVEEEGRGSGGG